MKATKHLALIHMDKDGDYYGSCACGQTSGPNRFKKIERWRAEDWCNAHLVSVQHALAVLHRSGGSVKIERDHARAMLDDPNTSAKDKETWKILFDGAEARLRDLGGPDPTQEGLW